jgi:hypothetical protein
MLYTIIREQHSSRTWRTKYRALHTDIDDRMLADTPVIAKVQGSSEVGESTAIIAYSKLH